MALLHDFVSPEPADADPTIVDGPKWNSAHKFSGANLGALLRVDAADAINAINSAAGVLSCSAAGAVPSWSSALSLASLNLTDYFAIGTNPASAGALRLDNNTYINWRNAANTADLGISISSGDALFVNTSQTISTSASQHLLLYSPGTGQVSLRWNHGGTAGDWQIVLPASSSDLMWWSGGDQLRLTTAGQLLAIVAPNTSTPPYTFTGDSDTGMASAGADVLSLIAGGSTIWGGTQLTLKAVQHEQFRLRHVNVAITLDEATLNKQWKISTGGGGLYFNAFIADAYAATPLQIDTANYVVGINTANASAQLNVVAKTASLSAIFAQNAINSFSVPTIEVRAQLNQTTALQEWRSTAPATLLAVTVSGAFDLTEQVAPAAPAANVARLYSDDSGGKTRLMVRFGSGAAQQIAIEP